MNIEKSLTINKLLSGHIVQGHVDTCTEITELKKIDNSWYVKIKIDSSLYEVYNSKRFNYFRWSKLDNK